MWFNLKGYDNKLVSYYLSEEDISKIKQLVLATICGDQVLYVFYNNGEKEVYDATGVERCRTIDALDDIELLTIDELKEMNKFF